MADLQKEVSSRFTQDMSRYTEEVNAREAKIKHLELELKKDGQ